MESEEDVMRMLHRVQRRVPGRDFFIHSHQGMDRKVENKKGGLFSRSSKAKEKNAKFDLSKAREQVKAFHNTFLATVSRDRKNGDSTAAESMSIADMKAFRQKIRGSVEQENADPNCLALDCVVRYIDLKNSAVVTGKEEILLECLRKVGDVLLEDGGLSMFHTTWFLSIYRDYIAKFRMFNSPSELRQAQETGNQEARAIIRRLTRKQFEIPQYLQLVDDKVLEVRQINRYSKDILVKMSKHGQEGCTAAHIRKVFLENLKSGYAATRSKTKLDEISIIMAYALLFARIPMMEQLVDHIKDAIPKVNVDTALYKEKIVLAKKISLLETTMAMQAHDYSDDLSKNLNLLAHSAHKHCTKLILDNNLDQIELTNDIRVYPIIKQSVIAITYKDIFNHHTESYLKLLDSSKKSLEAASSCANSSHKTIRKMAEQAEAYSRNIDTIIRQIRKVG